MANQDMLINFVQGEECRIALVEDGKLEELYTERTSADLHVGNIYRGRVTNVEPSIQAAFVDFGLERSGFLHISDLHPRFFPGEDREQTERVGHKTPRRDRPPIQQALKRGQALPVQVLKEGIGSKGPTVSSYLSIPGRFLVMMPYMERHGVSRKVEDEEKRREARRILDELNPPDNFGFIVRTAGFGRPKSELKRDLNYLLRLWKDIERRMKRGRGPAELYAESDLIIRTLRDVMTSDVKRIIVDDRIAALRAKQFLKLASPRTTTKVIYYKDHMPLFDAFDVERQIQQINSRSVPLDCGGSLVIDQTEAMVAVDVNSGKFRDQKDAEQTAYLTNTEAIDEIARQLRLRDLGGLLVLDLIDMYANRHRRAIERRFRENLKKDRARTKVLKISELGLLEMTRQRMRPSLKKSVYEECFSCTGTGQVLSAESVALEVMRRIAVTLHANRVAKVELTAHPDVITMLLNRRREALVELEEKSGKPISFAADDDLGPDHVNLRCLDAQDRAIDLEKLPKPRQPRFNQEDEIDTADLDDLDEALRLPSMEDDDEAPESKEKEKADGGEASGDAAEGGAKRKRRRRRRRRGGREEGSEGDGGDSKDQAEARHGRDTEEGGAPDSGEEESGTGRKRRRRRSRSGRGEDGEPEQRREDRPVSGGYQGAPEAEAEVASGPAPGNVAADVDQEVADRASSSDGGERDGEGEGEEGNGNRRRRRRRRGGRRRRRKSDQAEASDGASEGSSDAPVGSGVEEGASATESPAADRAEDDADETIVARPAAEDEQAQAGASRDADPSEPDSVASADARSEAASAEGASTEADAAPPKRRPRGPRGRRSKPSDAAETPAETEAAAESAEDKDSVEATNETRPEAPGASDAAPSEADTATSTTAEGESPPAARSKKKKKRSKRSTTASGTTTRRRTKTTGAKKVAGGRKSSKTTPKADAESGAAAAGGAGESAAAENSAVADAAAPEVDEADVSASESSST